MRIHARGIDFRNAVMELLHDLGGDLLGMIGDDLETVRRLEALQDDVADLARDKERDESQQDGFELFRKAHALIVYKEGGKHYDRVEHGSHAAHAQVAEFFVDQRRKNRRPAARAAAFERYRERHAEEHAARDRRENVVILGLITDILHAGDIIEHDEKPRSEQHGERGNDRAVFSDQKERHKKQGYVEHDQKDTGVPARPLLQKNGDAVHAARRKVVGRNEDIDRQRPYDPRNDDGQHGHVKKVPDLFPDTCLPLCGGFLLLHIGLLSQ